MTKRRLLLITFAVTAMTAAAWHLLGQLHLPTGKPTTPSSIADREAPQAGADETLISGDATEIDRRPASDIAADPTRVSGRVLASELAIPLHAIVRDGEGSSVWTDPDTGEFSISTRSPSLTAWASGYSERKHPLATDGHAIITLDALSQWSIKVTDRRGVPVPGADIVQLRHKRGAPSFDETVLGQTGENGTLDITPSDRAALLFARTHDSISHPLYCGHGDTLVCDDSTTAHISVHDSSGNPVECLLHLSMLDLLPGVTWRTRCTKQHGALLPAGAYAVILPGHGKAKDLPPALACNGQILIAASGQMTTLRVAEQAERSVSLRNADSRSIVEGTASVEILEASGWQSIGATVHSDENGRIDIGELAAVTTDVSDDYKRLRFSSPGFHNSFAYPRDLSSGSFIDMLPGNSTITIRISRDGKPYGGSVAIRGAIDGADEGPILYEGSVPDSGVAVPYASATQLIIYESRTSTGREITRSYLSDSVRSDNIHIELPRSAEIVVTGGPPSVDVCAMAQSGELFRGQYQSDSLLISDLFPGQYIVGLSALIGAQRQEESVAEVLLEAGQRVEVPWSDHWTLGPPIGGQVRTSAPYSDELLRQVRVVACSGEAPSATAALYQSATPLKTDGRFLITNAPITARHIAVVGLLHGGSPVGLGTFPIDHRNNLVIRARPVTIVFEDAGPRPRAILLAVPPDAQGRGAGQWLIPGGAQDSLDLGLVPDAIQSARLIEEGRTRLVTFPATGECIVRVRD